MDQQPVSVGQGADRDRKLPQRAIHLSLLPVQFLWMREKDQKATAECSDGKQHCNGCLSGGKNVMLHSCLEVVGAKSSEVGTVHNESASQ